MDLEVGSEFAGYRLEALAGRGGMGVVFRARNLITEQERAIKIIAPHMSADVSFRERFKRESRLAARLDHPNVIPVHEAREEGGLLYLVMPFIEGSDLSTVLKRDGRLDPARAAAIFSQVAAALDAAHSAGLIHRDVKPANVLLAEVASNERVYLTDFGLVKDLNSSSSFTETGVFMGTYNYAAPEQIDPSGGHTVDHRADIYAFACMAYHALAGVVPFPRSSVQAIMAAHLFQDPPDIREQRGDLSKALAEVLQRSMAKDPARRHETAGQLALALAVTAEEQRTPRRAPHSSAAAGPEASTPASLRDRGDRRPAIDAGAAAARPRSITGRAKRRWQTLAVVVATAATVGAAVAALALTGSSATTDERKRAPEGQAAAKNEEDQQPRVLGQIALRPRGGGNGQGAAFIVQVGSRRYLVVQAKLPPLPQNQREAAYQVWLFNSREDATSVGAQFTDGQGNYQGRQELPEDFSKYKFVDITREPFDEDKGHSGNSVLRGTFANLQPVPEQRAGQSPTVPAP